MFQVMTKIFGEKTSVVLLSNGIVMEITNCGWEIDHFKADSEGGEDVVSNARPLQWYIINWKNRKLSILSKVSYN